MWCSASAAPMPRLPEWSISQTLSSVSRQTSMKWLPPPSVPSWQATLFAQAVHRARRARGSRPSAPRRRRAARRRRSPRRPRRWAARPTGMARSMAARSRRRSSGRSSLVRLVSTAAMPQPMSTPTAAGATAPRMAITEPTVAPRPAWTSGMTATWCATQGRAATFLSWVMTCESTSCRGAQTRMGTLPSVDGGGRHGYDSSFRSGARQRPGRRISPEAQLRRSLQCQALGQAGCGGSPPHAPALRSGPGRRRP